MTTHDSAPASTGIEDRGREVLLDGSTPDTNTAANAKQLRFHPLAGVFPLMEGEEFDALVADIKANGLRDQIILYHGMILDGRNRYRACLAAGWTPAAIDNMSCEYGRTRLLEDDAEAAAYVISANIHRRHLTAEDKRNAIAQLVAAQPAKSDRELAKQAGVSHPTIAKARRTAEATGKALPVDKRVGADGKARKLPAKKKDADSKVRKAAQRKPTKRQLERDERDRRFKEETDRVVAILIERLGRDGLVLVAAALQVLRRPRSRQRYLSTDRGHARRRASV